MKKIVMFLIGIIIVNHNLTAQQLTPSIYMGYGVFTNLGGCIGIGTEWQYKFLSLNTAVGLAQDGHLPGIKLQDFDCDMGIKLHCPEIGIFGGINYGLIAGGDNGTRESIKKTYGFSFTVGYKHTIYKHIYGLCYFGTTSKQEVNQGLGFYFPRIGFIIGYTFRPVKLKIDL